MSTTRVEIVHSKSGLGYSGEHQQRTQGGSGIRQNEGQQHSLSLGHATRWDSSFHEKDRKEDAIILLAASLVSSK